MGKRRANARRGAHRAYLRKWSHAFINTGSYNPAITAECVALVKTIPDPVLERMFPGIQQNQPGVGRKEALRRRVSMLLEDTEKDNHEVILNSPGKQVLLFYNHSKTSWFFVRKTSEEIHTSHTYPSKQIAQRLWDDGNVVFDIRETLAPT